MSSIAPASPLALGLTVNIAPTSADITKPWRLRLWANGKPEIDEQHPDAASCAKALAANLAGRYAASQISQQLMQGLFNPGAI